MSQSEVPAAQLMADLRTFVAAQGDLEPLMELAGAQKSWLCFPGQIGLLLKVLELMRPREGQKMTVLLGRPGSGKSTWLSLLSNYYDLYGARIWPHERRFFDVIDEKTKIVSFDCEEGDVDPEFVLACYSKERVLQRKWLNDELKLDTSKIHFVLLANSWTQVPPLARDTGRTTVLYLCDFVALHGTSRHEFLWQYPARIAAALVLVEQFVIDTGLYDVCMSSWQYDTNTVLEALDNNGI